MSTIYNFHQECPEVDSLAIDDELLVYDTSTGRTKTMTGVMSQDKVVTSITTGTTNISSNGVTILGTTVATNVRLDAPVVGREKILIATSTTANIVTCTTVGGTVTIGSTGTILTFGTTGANSPAQVRLIASSVTRWEIAALTGLTPAVLT